MSKHGKKYNKAAEKVVPGTILPVQDALKQVKELAYAKFDETVDAHINLGIDASKGDQAVRGSVVLPHGKGKKVRIIVFSKGDADEALKAGADFVGADDLVEKSMAVGWTSTMPLQHQTLWVSWVKLLSNLDLVAYCPTKRVAR